MNRLSTQTRRRISSSSFCVSSRSKCGALSEAELAFEILSVIFVQSCCMRMPSVGFMGLGRFAVRSTIIPSRS